MPGQRALATDSTLMQGSECLQPIIESYMMGRKPVAVGRRMGQVRHCPLHCGASSRPANLNWNDAPMIFAGNTAGTEKPLGQ